jgi:rubrerythrin
MERYSIREVVDQALQTERLGYQFYTTMIQTFEKEEGMRKLFSILAHEEKQHEKTFEGMLALVKDEEPVNWEEAEQYLRAIVESEFFLGKNKALPSMEHVKTVVDAVDFALEFEKQTFLYFNGLKDWVKEKEIVDKIIDEEKKHIMYLNKFKSGLGKGQ